MEEAKNCDEITREEQQQQQHWKEQREKLFYFIEK
jgi:hypothetical protein